MSGVIDDTRAILQGSRNVADNADFLSLVLSSGDQSRIENAVDDLLAAYDSYTGQARSYNSRLGFDEVAKLTDPEKRDQSATSALASALIDLEVAVVLGQAAQATAELEGQADAADLDRAIAILNETLKAIEGLSGAVPGATRLAFDEGAVSQAQEAISSPDLPTAKVMYEEQVKTFYDALLTETTTLLTAAFEQVSGLDADKIKKGLQTISGPLEGLAASPLTTRVLEATRRAVDTLKGILGPEILSKIEEDINKILDEIRQGENALQLFLKHSYSYEAGQNNIASWLQTSQANQATIDNGALALRELQQQMMQVLAMMKRIVTTLRDLSQPLEWVLKKMGGTLPLELLMGGVFLLVIDVALLRGMDYADTAQIIKWVDGVVAISQRVLVLGVN